LAIKAARPKVVLPNALHFFFIMSTLSAVLLAFPQLPQSPDGEPWSGSVNRAYDIIRTSVRHAQTLALQEDGADRTRALVTIANLQKTTLPLIQKLSNVLQDEQFKIAAARTLGGILAMLERSAAIETNR
jgi:hypothetical protein